MNDSTLMSMSDSASSEYDYSEMDWDEPYPERVELDIHKDWEDDEDGETDLLVCARPVWKSGATVASEVYEAKALVCSVTLHQSSES